MEEITPLYVQVLRFVIENQKLSMRDIQKKFHLAYNAAGRIVVWMEEKGYITPFSEDKPRDILITMQQEKPCDQCRRAFSCRRFLTPMPRFRITEQNSRLAQINL